MSAIDDRNGILIRMHRHQITPGQAAEELRRLELQEAREDRAVAWGFISAILAVLLIGGILWVISKLR